jgi:hypothetical protein
MDDVEGGALLQGLASVSRLTTGLASGVVATQGFGPLAQHLLVIHTQELN